ncbi:MAG TPA: asparagine synthase (glutamine-hydrolyzing), partial [Humisphaera sp.]
AGADAAGSSPPAAPPLRAMSDAVAHRGPDDAGDYRSTDGTCSLGHRRLSVIDLACGHQPLGNEDGSVQVVFNGEVYNFAELRAELASAGHTFRTASDTEVLAHGWEQWGTDLPGRLRGMFAFAVWDDRRRQLFLARDPLGKKPLYYGTHAGVLRFGSELKALLADPAFPRDVDRDAVLLYLNMGYVPDPWTILRGARKLPPGHWMLVERGAERVERYWSPPTGPAFRGSFADGCARFRELFDRAVRRRLVADVPLGAFLSGGIDSTAVVAAMSRLAGGGVKTFTISFDEARYDEAPFARVVAGRFRTDHHEMKVRADAVEVLPTLARHFDEPFADSSAIPTYYVSKLTRQHVTVALTGDGGDELFGGYRRYRVGKVAGWLGRVPGGRGLASLGRHLLPASVDRTTNAGRLKRMLDTLGGTVSAGYLAQMTQFAPATLFALVSPEFAAGVDRELPLRWFSSLYEPSGESDPAAAHMRADLLSYLPGDILTKVDRASMAVALECRSPFLDVDLAEFACGLPTAWRLGGLFDHKRLVKAALADVLPPEVVNRRKAGFAVPLPQWLRGPLKPVVHDVLLDATARGRGVLQATEVERIVAEHEAGARNHSGSIWAMLMLEMWFRTWGA